MLLLVNLENTIAGTNPRLEFTFARRLPKDENSLLFAILSVCTHTQTVNSRKVLQIKVEV